MFHLLLRLLLLGAAVVFALVAFVHTFPVLLILLAAFGVFKLCPGVARAKISARSLAVERNPCLNY